MEACDCSVSAISTSHAILRRLLRGRKWQAGAEEEGEVPEEEGCADDGELPGWMFPYLVGGGRAEW